MHLLRNRSYTIVDICAEKVERFHTMGLSVNARLSVKYVQNFLGPIVIEVEGRRIALRRKEFACLTLKEIAGY